MKAVIKIEFEPEEDWSLQELKQYAEDAAGVLWADNNFSGTYSGDAEILEE